MDLRFIPLAVFALLTFFLNSSVFAQDGKSPEEEVFCPYDREIKPFPSNDLTVQKIYVVVDVFPKSARTKAFQESLPKALRKSNIEEMMRFRYQDRFTIKPISWHGMDKMLSPGCEGRRNQPVEILEVRENEGRKKFEATWNEDGALIVYFKMFFADLDKDEMLYYGEEINYADVDVLVNSLHHYLKNGIRSNDVFDKLPAGLLKVKIYSNDNLENIMYQTFKHAVGGRVPGGK